MAFAYFMGHVANAKATFLLPILNGGELAVVWCFLFLYFATAGSGAFSIDKILARKKA
jgi:putative oxidoreductase